MSLTVAVEYFFSIWDMFCPSPQKSLLYLYQCLRVLLCVESVALFSSVRSILRVLVISSCLSVQACQIRRSGQAVKRLDSGEPAARDRFVP